MFTFFTVKGITCLATSPEARVSTNGVNVRTFDDKILEDIRENYTSHIGPLTSRLVKYHSSKTNSLEQW